MSWGGAGMGRGVETVREGSPADPWGLPPGEIWGYLGSGRAASLSVVAGTTRIGLGGEREENSFDSGVWA